MGTHIYGGRENLDTISFLKEFNEAVYSNYEGVQTIAEESTSFPMVSNQLWVVWVLE
jgi:1,4-alpha-glucan branching enzyme